MRLSPLVLVIGLVASSVSAPVASQKPDDQIAPASVALVQQGETLLAAGRLIEADDALEAALVADPRNRAAFVAMAKVAARQKLFGQAIRMTNKALALEPNDRLALEVQGEAMVELGATARAKDVLAKLQKACGVACPEAAQLSAAIARGPSLAAAKTPPSPKVN